MTLPALALGTMLISPSVLSAGPEVDDRWSYAEPSYIRIDSKDGADMDGFAVGAKYAPNDIGYISGGYQRYGAADVDTERYLLGLGARYALSESIVPFVQVDRVSLLDISGSSSSGSRYRIYTAGLSGAFGNVGYKFAATHYDNHSIGSRTSSGHYAELYYSINKRMSLGVNLESIDSDGQLVGYTLRHRLR